MDKRHACKHGNTDVVYCYQRANHVAYRLVVLLLLARNVSNVSNVDTRQLLPAPGKCYLPHPQIVAGYLPEFLI